MTDLRQRFDDAKRIRVPDLRAEVERRARSSEPFVDVDAAPSPSSRQRLVAAAVAALIFIATVSFLWRALDRSGVPLTSATGPARLRAVVTDQIPVAEFPNAVFAAESSVWVAAPRGQGGGAGDVLRIDPATGTIIATIPVPASALPSWEFGNAGFAEGLGSIWVAGGTTVSRINPTTHEVTSFPVGDDVDYVADVYVSSSDVWILAEPSGSQGLEVLRLDPTDGSIRTTIDVPVDWSQTLFGLADGSLWIYGDASTPDSTVGLPFDLVRIDTTTLSVAETIPVPRDGCPTLLGEGLVWKTPGGFLRYENRQTAETHIDGTPCDLLWLPIPDGVGGAWIPDIQAGVVRHLDHLDAEGTLVEVVSGDVGGLHQAFDPGTKTFWFAQVRDDVLRVALEPESSDPTAQDSESAEAIAVPNVEGLSQRDALVSLTDVGLAGGTVSPSSRTLRLEPSSRKSPLPEPRQTCRAP